MPAQPRGALPPEMPIADRYQAWKGNHPYMAGALEILPVTGQALAGVNYYDAMRDGDTQRGVLSAIDFIPGVKLAKMGGMIAPSAVRWGMNGVERFLDPAVRRAGELAAGSSGVNIAEAVAGDMKNQDNNSWLAQQMSAIQKFYSQPRSRS